MSTSDRHRLSWTAVRREAPLPAQIKRTYVRTLKGPLELLIAQPPKSFASQPRKKALLFQHGGFGSAPVWIPFMTYFSQTHGHPCYAVSLRGHGASWYPGYLTMVFTTGRASMAQDLGHALNWVQGFEAGRRGGDLDPEEIVLIGHSAGGGLSQYFLSQGLNQVGGLVLMAPFPSFGGLGVYWNWALLDPLFSLRMYFRDFGHTRSPLSSTTLIHHAFFCSVFPTSGVQEFEPNMPEYESLLWPLGMMFPFVTVRNVLRNIVGRAAPLKTRLFVVSGSKDTLMGVVLMRRMAEQYRRAFVGLIRRKLLQVGLSGADVDDKDGSAAAVGFIVIEGAGHYIQNDLQWEDAASQILAFVEKL